MAKFESKHVNVNGAMEAVHAYLQNMENIQRLLPKDKISNWQCDADSCSFKIQNVYTLGLKRTTSSIDSDKAETVFQSTDSSPFPFTLTANLKANGSTTEAFQLCDASINPFMEMMVKGPLQSLFDYMAERLEKEFAEKN
jgi:hypothetical protein